MSPMSEYLKSWTSRTVGKARTEVSEVGIIDRLEIEVNTEWAAVENAETARKGAVSRM